MPSSTSFSPVAGCYDASRVLPDAVLDAVIDHLEAVGGIVPGLPVLDVGCGTGQFALALARRGHDALGVDLSVEMLRTARGKDPERAVGLLAGDACALPFADAGIGLCIASKLFMHIADWQRAADEIPRVLVPRGLFVHCNETGYFNNRVRRRFRRLAVDRGYRGRFPGPLRPEQIRTYYLHRGHDHQLLTDERLSWSRQVRYQDAFRELERRSFAEFWMIPKPVYDAMLRETADWIAILPDGFDTVEAMTPTLRVDLFRC